MNIDADYQELETFRAEAMRFADARLQNMKDGGATIPEKEEAGLKALLAQAYLAGAQRRHKRAKAILY